MTRKLMEKAVQCKSPDEIKILAMECGKQITDDEAATYFQELNKLAKDISEDELGDVTGGGRINSYPLIGGEDMDKVRLPKITIPLRKR